MDEYRLWVRDYLSWMQAIPWWLWFFLAFFVSWDIVSLQVSHGEMIQPHSDALGYLSIAVNLKETGYFTNGILWDGQAAEGRGMFFSPLYPWFLSVLMRLDHNFYEMAHCLLENTSANLHENCSGNLNILILTQTLIASVSLSLVWLSAVLLTKNMVVGWLAWVLAAIAEAYAYYAVQALTENFVFPLFTIFSLLLCLGIIRKQPWLLFAGGLVIGMTALVRPSFSYVAYAGAVCFVAYFLLVLYKGGAWRAALRMGFLFSLGYALTVAPWVMRNGAVFGEYAISRGYAPFILVQRASYNEMTAKEWVASFVYGLPDFGDSLARRIFEKQDYARFDYGDPEGFYQQGNGAFRQQAIENAGGEDKLFPYLLRNYVVADFPKHSLVTLSLAWSGMWVSKYWGLIAIPAFFAAWFLAPRALRLTLMLYAAPAWFMLGLHAFTSVNVVRYNLILIPCLAIGTSWFLYALWQRMQGGRS